MKRPYESIIIFDGTLSEDSISSESGKIQEFISKNAQFENLDVWGKKHLAYMLKKKKSGVYHRFVYTAEGDIAAKLEKFLKLNETVLRHLTVVRVDRTIKAAVTEPISAEGRE